MTMVHYWFFLLYLFCSSQSFALFNFYKIFFSIFLFIISSLLQTAMLQSDINFLWALIFVNWSSFIYIMYFLKLCGAVFVKKNVALWKNPTNIKWNNVDGKQTPSYVDQQLQAPRARSWDNFIFYVVPRVVLIFGFIFVYVLAH